MKLAVGDTQLACGACGLAAPLSGIGTAPGTGPTAQLALETDLTGTIVAGRTLVEKIGAGGMGTVYRARGDNNVDVAIKILRPGLGAERAAMLARFSREAEAMRRLEHAHVVRFLDHGEDGETAYIITELVEGKDLAARLSEGRMTLAEIVDVFGQVCDGVAAAHAAGIVHRDLKPANILVGKSGVKVADFGLAQLGADVAIPTLTRTNVAMGTFHYLAPEQRKDARTVDHRADIWALGVILYEMLTGELPLGSFAAPSTLGPTGTNRRVDAIVNRALAPDPAARYADVVELARDVRSLAARPRRLQRVAIAAGAVLALAGGSTAAAVALTHDTSHVAPQAVATQDAGTATTNVAVIADAAIEAAPPDAVEVAAAPTPAVVPVGKPQPPKPGGVSKPGKPGGVSKPGGKLGGKTGGKSKNGSATVPAGVSKHVKADPALVKAAGSDSQ
ncbi:MAG TPA: serine/threonine-protein kinase [Kofleriaceae bacterium]|nr:serine/threonine-protein kinase [Kofleriaceae bacterium]